MAPMRLGFALVGVLAIAGCALFRPSIGDDLIGPVWIVTDIDGEEVPFGEIYLTFDGNTATLITHIGMPPPPGGGLMPRCRESVSEVAMDTDGRALNFIEFVPLELSAREDAPCDAALAALHDRIAAALRGNESWEPTSDTRIELVGTSRVGLENADPGS